MDFSEFVDSQFDEHGAVTLATQECCGRVIWLLRNAARKALAEGGTIYLFGNGGSAADAQHIAAELVVRYKSDRDPFAAIALTTDSSVLTAIGNDLGFEHIFERQIRALGTPGDLAIGISTSGYSINVTHGLAAAEEIGMATALLTSVGCVAFELAEIMVKVPSENTARIQEMHILIGHMLCAALERDGR